MAHIIYHRRPAAHRLSHGLRILCHILQEEEDGWTVEGDGLQTCRVAGKELVMSSQVIDDHIAVGTVNLMRNDPSSERFYHTFLSKDTLQK